MKIRLILATSDREYAERFASGLSLTQDSIKLTTCTNLSKLNELLTTNRYDICLADSEALACLSAETVKLIVLLRDPRTDEYFPIDGLNTVKKYQRISTIASQLIRMYADVADQNAATGNGASITVVWSPSGGCGKTTVAAAYAARMAHAGRNTTYLNLEDFASVEALFPKEGISLSAVFDQMASNVALQLLSMKTTDSATGINYFGAPNNFDDMNVLSDEECYQLTQAAASNTDELVVDLSSACNSRTQSMFEMATRILLVSDNSRMSKIKLNQFMTQSNVFLRYKHKMVLVSNKGASAKSAEELELVRLPLIESQDPVTVFQKLSGYNI